MDINFFQNIFDKAAIGITVTDEKHRIIRVNGVLENIFGYEKGGMMGLSISQITAPGFMEENSRLFQDLLSGEIPSYQMIKRYVRKDGDEFWGKVTVSIMNRSTEGTQILGLFEDVTDQKNLERDLSKSEERFRQIITSMYDWVWEVDQNGVYTFVSSQVKDILGYKPDEVVGKTPFDFMPTEEANRVAKKFMEIAQKKAEFNHLENRNIHKDGQEVLIETSGVPVLNRAGELLGYRGVDRDITEKKRMELELEQSRKLQAVGQLTGGISHDFNNILHVMIGNLHLIEEDVTPNSEMSELVKDAIEIGSRGSHLIQQLLEFSGRQKLAPELIQPNSLIENLIPLLTHTLGGRIKIIKNLTTELPPIFADSDSLHTALINLAINSRDAMPNGGVITISTSLEQSKSVNDSIAIKISDSGLGMSEATIAKAIEPFYTTKDIGKGSGLGLSMVYGYMKKSNGQLKISSSEGEGTSIQLIFPAVNF